MKWIRPFIFIITIIILDCNGIRLREPRRSLESKASNVYAGKRWSGAHKQPPLRQHKTGDRRDVEIGNTMKYMYGRNKDTSEVGDFNEAFRLNHAPEITAPTLLLVLQESEEDENSGSSEEDRFKVNPQNDWKFPARNVRRTNPLFNFTEQKRAINLLELPIAHYIKDYHKIELEIQKREAEMKQNQQNRKGAEIHSTKTDPPVDYFSQNYNRFKAEMMHHQNRFQTMPKDKLPQKSESDSQKLHETESLLQEYERKQDKLYNIYDGRVSNPERPEPQRQHSEDPQFPSPLDIFLFPRPQSQDPQIPRPQSQEPQIPRPQSQDPQIPRPNSEEGMIPGPQSQDPQTPRPQSEDGTISRLESQDFVPRPHFEDAMIPRPEIQDRMAPRPPAPERQTHHGTGMKDVHEIFNDLHNWQPEPSPIPTPVADLKSLGIKPGEENYNWQAVLDQSSINLADISTERLVSEYRKLEQELIRRKNVLEIYKNSLKKAELVKYSEKLKQPFYSSSLLQDPRGSMGPAGQSGPLNLLSPPEPPDRYPTSPTQRPEMGFKERATRSVPDMLWNKVPKSMQRRTTATSTQSPLDEKFQILRELSDLRRDAHETEPDFGIPYMSDAELASYIANNQPVQVQLIQHNRTMHTSTPPTGIVKYANRKSMLEPKFDQLYIIYLQRVRRVKPKIKRRGKKPLDIGHQYAYVNLERLQEVIKQFRRQRATPDLRKGETVYDEPSISSEETDEEDKTPEFRPTGKKGWFINSADAFNHIRIDPEAPNMSEFMPKRALEDYGNKWWFYHQNDFVPFRQG